MIARNVVQLAGSQLDGRAKSLIVDIPESVKLSKNIATKRLNELLSTMFDNVDDCLFDYADKAGSNQQQMHYFDAMRELRIQKKNMIKVFFKEFDKQFEDIIHGNFNLDSSNKTYADDFTSLNLSLVGEEELELDLAITNMIEKIHNNYRDSIIALAKRTDYALGEIGITTENQPLSARTICNSIASSIETLSVEIEIKLIVFKLFDKYIIQCLGDIYVAINQMFIDNGILPHIKIKLPVRSASSPHSSNSDHETSLLDDVQTADPDQARYDALASGAASELLDANAFDVIQQLMSRNRASILSGEVSGPVSGAGVQQHVQGQGVQQAVAGQFVDAGSANQPGKKHSGSTAGQVITGTFPVRDVVSGLSALQQNSVFVTAGSGETTEGVPAQGATADVIKLSLVEALSTIDPDSGENKVIDDAEVDAIDIVSLLFDFILEDKGLPDRLKALIAKLQIPFVKLAILDKSFFAKKSHPARLLLNELAYAASGSEDGVDVDDNILFEAMDTIVNRITSDFEMDTTIFDELLEEFRDFCDRESKANRMAQQMLEKTKETVASEIEHRVTNNRMPVSIKRFLRRNWKDVMTSIGVRDACEGVAWEAAINVMDDLIWSIQPKLVVQEQTQLTGLIPKILNGLQDGLILIGLPQSEIYAIFGTLEELHHASLKGLREVNKQSTNHATPDEIEYDMEEIVLEDESQGDDLAAIKQSKFYYLVKSMEQGTWVSFKTEDGIKRGRLAWKCEFTGEYSFVNRRYQLVKDITLDDLVVCFDQQTAELIEELPLFDRAVNAVVNGLKQCLSDDKQVPDVDVKSNYESGSIALDE